LPLVFFKVLGSFNGLFNGFLNPSFYVFPLSLKIKNTKSDDHYTLSPENAFSLPAEGTFLKASKLNQISS